MSRREQSDRHIIWSNMNLEADDWRDSYKEYLEFSVCFPYQAAAISFPYCNLRQTVS